MSNKTSSDQLIVTIDDKLRIKYISFKKYLKWSSSKRKANMDLLIECLKSMPGISLNRFQYSDGSFREYVTKEALESEINKRIVVVTPDLRFSDISIREFQAWPADKRDANQALLFHYLENIPSINLNKLKSIHGKIPYISRELLDEAITKVYTDGAQTQPITRLPSDICIAWVSSLEHTKKQLTATTPTLDRNKKLALLTTLIENQKAAWLKHNLTTEAVRSRLLNDSNQLRLAGLNELAELASSPNDKFSLTNQLSIFHFSNYSNPLQENKYSALFESLLIENLLKNPPKSLLKTMGEINNGLNLFLKNITAKMRPNIDGDEIDQYLLKFLDAKNKDNLTLPSYMKVKDVQPRFFAYTLQLLVNENPTYWLSKIPHVGDLINATDSKTILEIVQKLLTTVPTTGTEIVFTAYFVQKFYLAYRLANKCANIENPEWMNVTEKNYLRLRSKKDYIQEKTIFNKIQESGITQIFNDDQLSINSNSPSITVSQDRMKVGNFIKNALEHGIPAGHGISGTTNLFLGMLAHLNNDLSTNINVNEALLGLISFLVYDGGHSIHEALSTLHQRETFPLGHNNSQQLNYLKLGIDIKSATNGDFIADYKQFFELFQNSPEIKIPLEESINKAWEQTILYFDKKDHFLRPFKLQAVFNNLIDNLKLNPQTNIKKQLETILEKGQKSTHAVSKHLLINQLKSICTNLANDELKGKIISELNNIGYREHVHNKLTYTLSTFPVFKNFNINGLKRFFETNYQSYNDPDGYILMNSFNYMLKHVNSKFSSEFVTNLIRSYHISIENNHTIKSADPDTLFNIVDDCIENIYTPSIMMATTNEQKVAAIANTVTQLLKAFKEDTTKRAIEVLITTDLLLRNNLAPALFNNRLTNLSTANIIKEIGIGQHVFKAYTTPEPALNTHHRMQSLDFDPDIELLPPSENASSNRVDGHKEAYLNLRTKLEADKNADFILGISTHPTSKITIAGYYQGISLQEMYLLATHGGLTLKEQGALARLIDIAENEASVSSSQWLEQVLQKSAQTDRDLQKSLLHLTHVQDVADFHHATQNLYTHNQIDSKYIPLLESVQQTSISGKYSITVYDPTYLTGTRIQTIETNDETFIRIKQSLTNYTNPKTTNLKFGKPFPGTGLSLLFAAHAYFSSPEKYPNASLSQNLIKAMQLHYYVNMTNLGIGIAQEIFGIGMFGLKTVSHPLLPIIVYSNLKSYLKAANSIGLHTKPMETLVPKIIQQLSNKSQLAVKSSKGLLLFASKGIPVVSTLLNAVAVGFDAYELSQTKTLQDKKIFGTKLAFNAVGLGLTSLGTLSLLIGAGVATKFFTIAMPLAVVGGGIVQTMKLYANIEQLIKAQVVNYFNELKKTYQMGYGFDSASNSLYMLPEAVIHKIDLTTGTITMGDKYLHVRDEAYMRRVNSNNKKAISLRIALNGKSHIQIRNGLEASIIYLPNTPISYISYNTVNIQAFKEYKGDDYANIRSIEYYSNKKFKLEHFAGFIQSNIVYKLFHQYKLTVVEIILDQSNRTLIVPELPNQTAEILNKLPTIRFSNTVNDFEHDLNNNHQLQALSKILHYRLFGNGGQYVVALNEGANFSISSNKPSQWIFTTQNLDSDQIKISTNQLLIGDITIFINAVENNDNLLNIIRQNGDVYKVDPRTWCAKIIQLDASMWAKKNPNKLFETHLKECLQNDLFAAAYITIEKYAPPQIINRSRAYYDVKNERVLFSRNITIDGSLGAVFVNGSYFFNKEHGIIWETNFTGEVIKQYSFNQLPSLHADSMQIEVEQDQLRVTFDYETTQNAKSSIILKLKNETIELISIIINDHKSKKPSNQYIVDWFESYKMTKTTDSTTSKLISTTNIDTLTEAPFIVFYDHPLEPSYRYWLHTTDNTLIKPNLPYQPHTLAEFKLIGLLKHHDGYEYAYFFDASQHKLYEQQIIKIHADDFEGPRASPIVGTFTYAHITDNKLFAITQDALIQSIDGESGLVLTVANENWLKKQGSDWLINLHKINSESVIVLGLKSMDGSRLLPAWYHHKQLIIAPNLSNDETTIILAVYNDHAYLLDTEKIKLYRQNTFDDNTLLEAFGNDLVVDNDLFIDPIEEILPNENLNSVTYKSETLCITTTEGVVLHLDSDKQITLTGVDQSWLSEHPNTEADLNALAQKWSHNEAIILYGDNQVHPRWYVLGIGEIVINDASISTQFIGKSVTHSNLTSIYFTDLVKQQLYCYQYDTKGNFVKYATTAENVQRFGSTLLIQATETTIALKPILLPGINSVVLSSSGGSPHHFIINDEAKKKLKNIIIDTYAINRVTDHIELAVNNHYDLKLSAQDEDLIIKENDDQAIITIRKVLGKNKTSYNSLQLVTYDGITKHKVQLTDFIANTDWQTRSIINFNASSDSIKIREGGVENDVFVLAAGDGHTIIQDQGGDADLIKFTLEQMHLNDIGLERNNKDLIIHYNQPGDKVTIANHFNSNNGIEQFGFNNGLLYHTNTLTNFAASLTPNEKWTYSLSNLTLDT